MQIYKKSVFLVYSLTTFQTVTPGKRIDYLSILLTGFKGYDRDFRIYTKAEWSCTA